jgi:protein-arginine kinase
MENIRKEFVELVEKETMEAVERFKENIKNWGEDIKEFVYGAIPDYEWSIRRELVSKYHIDPELLKLTTEERNAIAEKAIKRYEEYMLTQK